MLSKGQHQRDGPIDTIRGFLLGAMRRGNPHPVSHWPEIAAALRSSQ
jgi:hypothetical protein